MEAELKERFRTALERAQIAFEQVDGRGESAFREAMVHLNVAGRIIDEARGKKTSEDDYLKRM